MQIKTCQDCDQLRPFTVKRTCPAKNRANSDIIESFFQEDPCMDLASRLIWRCFIETPSNESARKSKFCQIIWVTFITLWFHEFFQLLLILSSSKILCRFFCQIIMGSPLNSNVPDGRSVYLCKWCFIHSTRSRSYPSNYYRRLLVLLVGCLYLKGS